LPVLIGAVRIQRIQRGADSEVLVDVCEVQAAPDHDDLGAVEKLGDFLGERVIRLIDKPPRLSLLEYLYFAGDDRFGALGVSTSEESYRPRTTNSLPRLPDVAAVHDLVESYRAALGTTDFTLKYETLVSSQEAETRRLLDYLGLPFDEACLRFHESRRYAPTPSYAQVTQKMNDKSVDRHARYARHLLPFQSQMARILAAGGYG